MVHDLSRAGLCSSQVFAGEKKTFLRRPLPSRPVLPKPAALSENWPVACALADKSACVRPPSLGRRQVSRLRRSSTCAFCAATRSASAHRARECPKPPTPSGLLSQGHRHKRCGRARPNAARGLWPLTQGVPGERLRGARLDAPRLWCRPPTAGSAARAAHPASRARARGEALTTAPGGLRRRVGTQARRCTGTALEVAAAVSGVSQSQSPYTWPPVPDLASVLAVAQAGPVNQIGGGAAWCV